MLAERCQSPCSEPLNPLPFFTDLLRDGLLLLESKSQEVKGFPFPHQGQSFQISPCISKSPANIALLFFPLWCHHFPQIAYWLFFSFLIEKNNNSLQVTLWFAQWCNSRESASKKQIPRKGSQFCLLCIYSGAIDRLRETESLLDTQWVQ